MKRVPLCRSLTTTPIFTDLTCKGICNLAALHNVNYTKLEKINVLNSRVNKTNVQTCVLV